MDIRIKIVLLLLFLSAISTPGSAAMSANGVYLPQGFNLTRESISGFVNTDATGNTIPVISISSYVNPENLHNEQNALELTWLVQNYSYANRITFIDCVPTEDLKKAIQSKVPGATNNIIVLNSEEFEQYTNSQWSTSWENGYSISIVRRSIWIYSADDVIVRIYDSSQLQTPESFVAAIDNIEEYTKNHGSPWDDLIYRPIWGNQIRSSVTSLQKLETDRKNNWLSDKGEGDKSKRDKELCEEILRAHVVTFDKVI